MIPRHGAKYTQVPCPPPFFQHGSFARTPHHVHRGRVHGTPPSVHQAAPSIWRAFSVGLRPKNMKGWQVQIVGAERRVREGGSGWHDRGLYTCRRASGGGEGESLVKVNCYEIKAFFQKAFLFRLVESTYHRLHYHSIFFFFFMQIMIRLYNFWLCLQMLRDACCKNFHTVLQRRLDILTDVGFILYHNLLLVRSSGKIG